MAKVIIHGVKEDGTFDAECISTAVLITELISKFPKMCEADIRHSLEEIRTSAEQDDRIRKTLAHSKRANEETVSRAVSDAIEVIKRCAETYHDMDAMMTVCRLCKLLVGDKFSVEVSTDK